jgi:MFS family permease
MNSTASPGPNALTSRTFIGLLVSQFFAAFNDQAIHAAAMFYAINTQTLSERDAITLMPILFYAPWALFCTLSGYFADRFSKRYTLITWKIAEIFITALAVVGFWLGRNGHADIGPWIVLATVFLMGMHSAFFVPAKYGVMPEILPPEQLSRGNGWLESLSFLAVILGTVSGGVMSYLFLEQEVYLGLILFGLAIVGAIASFTIRYMPPANPERPFPSYIYGPLWKNIRTLASVKSLRLAMIGIAFFTFVVAFMRAAVYMLGESQNPRWDELKTSVVVGTVAFGIGLGSPIAGWLSGRRVELRLVIIGTIGMILAACTGAYFIDQVRYLVLCIMTIGFCTGFYIVPLYTLLQHKAPKTSKGDMIATSNFVNISGAITASVMFFLVVFIAQKTNLIPVIKDRQEQVGILSETQVLRGRIVYFELTRADGSVFIGGKRAEQKALTAREIVDRVLEGSEEDATTVELGKRVNREAKPEVSVTYYELAGVTHYEIVPKGELPTPDYDQRHLPRFLFLGAALLTGVMLLVIIGPLRQVRREEYESTEQH